jgi:predicted naringenin-chalcone synthase
MSDPVIIENEALQLSAIERARLADRLIQSISHTPSELQALWASEADERMEAFKSGEIEAVDGPGQMLGWDLDSDGTAERHLFAETGGNLEMEGKEVFRKAVRLMVESANKSMAHAGVTADDIKIVIPHQANIRIISASMDRLGLPLERASIVLDKTGNTSAASIPLALNQALEDGRISDGDLVLFVGFGAGMSAASAIVRWNTTDPELHS